MDWVQEVPVFISHITYLRAFWVGEYGKKGRRYCNGRVLKHLTKTGCGLKKQTVQLMQPSTQRVNMGTDLFDNSAVWYEKVLQDLFQLSRHLGYLPQRLVLRALDLPTGGPGSGITQDMGDFSRSRNSKFTGIIKLKLTYLVPVFISLLLSQFQRAPLDITLSVGKMYIFSKLI